MFQIIAFFSTFLSVERFRCQLSIILQEDVKPSTSKSKVDLRSLPVVKPPDKSDSSSSSDSDNELIADSRERRTKIVQGTSKWTIGQIKTGTIFSFCGNPQWCVYATQILIDRLLLREEYCKRIGSYGRIMRRHLDVLTCPIISL